MVHKSHTKMQATHNKIDDMKNIKIKTENIHMKVSK